MTLLSRSSSSLLSPIQGTSTSTLPSSPDWKMVPFDPLQHKSQLEDVCSSSDGGSDYVLHTFREYVEDHKCFFQAVIKESKDNNNENDGSSASEKTEVDNNNNNNITLGAVGNLRILGNGQAWIEAIRTSSHHRNQGLATRLLHGLLDVAATNQECKSVLSCTSKTNDPMLHVFEKVGMKKLTHVKMVEFAEIRKIPGWRATSTSKTTTATTTSTESGNTKTQHLLHAFGIKDLVSCTAKSFQWSPVNNVDEIRNILRNIKKQGGAGFIPGLYEVVGVDSLVDKDGPFDNKLVFSLTKQVSGSVSDDDKDGSGDALICFKRDSRISSLKSKWVLSIAGTTEELVQAALWYACSPCIQKKLIEVEKRIASSKHIDKCDIDKNLIDDCDRDYDDDEIGFIVAMESAIPTNGSFFVKLPLTDDCVVYGKSL
eukprot:CAMPEP_0195296710 /NCGR_PEP_ID=MMETSP0707-20130614/20021_1 /TAXON_ID=33640 /ORGANISM="Asterionellopsis glacialis, Strain CCMP134" /LENGTH=427 /DNA_ID=CAMNT_0040358301 /DNA_START=205 /DNA_END=1488 /DNA_ORIENTATION=+